MVVCNLSAAGCGGQTDDLMVRTGGASRGGGSGAGNAGTGGVAAQGCTGPGGLGVLPAVATGSGPMSVVVGDFNLDKAPDLAVGNSLANTVSVLIGHGDGTFDAKRDYQLDMPTLDMPPYPLAVADFDVDGKPDLAIAIGSAGWGTANVLLGNGDGTFGAREAYALSATPKSTTVGDFDRDGKPDLAVAASGANTGTVSVFLGNGDGTLASAADYSIGQRATQVIARDFDLDGKPDLSVATPDSNTVSVLLGNGDGTFGAKVESATGQGLAAFAVGDFNLDGKPDLAALHSTGASAAVAVLLGTGDGTFGAPVEYPTGDESSYVVVEDFNLDGKPDLAVANPASGTSGTVSVLLGNGDGTFREKVDYVVRDAWNLVFAGMAVGDFDLDGKPDIAIADFQYATVDLLFGRCM
jgi:hypothetical protein